MGVLVTVIADKTAAQETESELYLSFNHKGVVNVYTPALYKNSTFYLSLNDLFRVLKVDHSVDMERLSVSGHYLNTGKRYDIDFKNLQARLGNRTLSLSSEDFMVRELGFYLSIPRLNELFDVEFSVNFNNLTLHLESDLTFPVVGEFEREQRRKGISQARNRFERTYHPLRYDRSHAYMDGGFLDYNLSAIYHEFTPLFTFSNSLGTEIAGGDIQGSLFGSLSEEDLRLNTSQLRWRYVHRNSRVFSSAIVGQTTSDGFTSRPITGVKFSNKPVEPRLLFDRYVIDGNTTPLSEVELYLNNSIIDYQEADESGNYRFLVPLTYGSSRYSLRIYSPTGQIQERDSRVQTPFDFLPPGSFDYTVSGGLLDNPLLGSEEEQDYTGSISFAQGLTRWMTVKGSSEYLSSYHDRLPTFTGTVSARIASKYLLSADINSENLYRLTSGVVFGSGMSLSADYSYNPSNSRLYNPGGDSQQGRFTLFTPFRIGKLPLNFRWFGAYQQQQNNESFRYRVDFNTRISRLNIRVGYQDQQNDLSGFSPGVLSRLTNSYTYAFGSHRKVPGLFRGLFLRGQLSWLPYQKDLEEVQFQLSRELFNSGQIQMSYGRNFLREYDTAGITLTLDFNRIRSNTSSRMTRNNYSVTQSLRGSVGFDSGRGAFLLSNRAQVGQAGAAVRLYLDNDADGAFSAETDEIIDEPAVRLNRAGGKTTMRNGVNYVSNLQSYYRYDLEINKSALSNPLLVPEVSEFSIVTDPNRYKQIDIPFYLSGVISGTVLRHSGETVHGLGGVRLILESRNTGAAGADRYFQEEVRSFADGSFYTYEIPPGEYNLFIEPSQLEFLNATSDPDTLQIEVESKPMGDFIENLAFNVIQSGQAVQREVVTDNLPPVTPDENGYIYRIQLASFTDLENAEELARIAENRLGMNFTIEQNANNNLHAVRSAPFPSRSEAVDVLLGLQNGLLAEAALVLSRPEPEAAGTGTEAFVQIGAYRTEYDAGKYAALSRIKLDRDPAVHYDEGTGLYSVRLFPEEGDAGSLGDLLAEVRSNPAYGDAFVKRTEPVPGDDTGSPRRFHYAYQVQIQGVTEEAEQAYVNSIIGETDTDLVRPEEDIVVFDGVESWNEARDLRDKLSLISSMGRPIIVLIEVEEE